MCRMIQESWTPVEERHRRMNNPAANEIVTPEIFRVPTVRTSRQSQSSWLLRTWRFRCRHTTNLLGRWALIVSDHP